MGPNIQPTKNELGTVHKDKTKWVSSSRCAHHIFQYWKNKSQTWPIHNFSRTSSRTESPGINHDRNASQGPILTIMTHRIPASRRPSSLFSPVRAWCLFSNTNYSPLPILTAVFPGPVFLGEGFFCRVLCRREIYIRSSLFIALKMRQPATSCSRISNIKLPSLVYTVYTYCFRCETAVVAGRGRTS